MVAQTATGCPRRSRRAGQAQPTAPAPRSHSESHRRLRAAPAIRRAGPGQRDRQGPARRGRCTCAVLLRVHPGPRARPTRSRGWGCRHTFYYACVRVRAREGGGRSRGPPHPRPRPNEHIRGGGYPRHVFYYACARERARGGTGRRSRADVEGAGLRRGHLLADPVPLSTSVSVELAELIPPHQRVYRIGLKHARFLHPRRPCRGFESSARVGSKSPLLYQLSYRPPRRWSVEVAPLERRSPTPREARACAPQPPNMG